MWFGGMLLWMALFWVGVIALAMWVASLLFPRVPAAQPSPRAILQARYAQGELTRMQYEETLNALTGRKEEGR